MRLRITHRTEYSYAAPVTYALQRVRLVPYGAPTQKVLSWSLAVEGAREEVSFLDQFGNETRLLSIRGEPRLMAVVASGEVETTDTSGVMGPHRGFAPLWLFQRETTLTMPGPEITALAAGTTGKDGLERLHGLMDAVGTRVSYRKGSTHTDTNAEEALAQGQGVCQDHAHIFAAAARLMGFPARYASGYLRMDGETEQVASHAWAEAHVPGLGWVGFDPANCVSPDDRYVRVATGLDYRDAAPISGLRLGTGEESMSVRITVEQQ
jgi:transglutaminase-like putative cysteine protease